MRTFHYVARALRGTLLARDHRELLELFRVFTAALPTLIAACAMPDHVHLLLSAAVPLVALGHVMSSYARWFHARGGTSGPLWRPLDAPVESLGDVKLRRDVRYIHLNPCRARLVNDPLAWPASTHRDATGLALWPVIPPVRDPDAFHAYVSGDPTVAVEGTLLPSRSLIAPTLEEILAATSALGRRIDTALSIRSPGRAVLVRAARVLTSSTSAEIAEFAGISQRAVLGVPRIADARTSRIATVAGDPRFPLLGERPVPSWERYRAWRAAVAP
jgi:hypothetical protein